jgi:hypothetical protein
MHTIARYSNIINGQNMGHLCRYYYITMYKDDIPNGKQKVQFQHKQLGAKLVRKNNIHTKSHYVTSNITRPVLGAIGRN